MSEQEHGGSPTTENIDSQATADEGAASTADAPTGDAPTGDAAAVPEAEIVAEEDEIDFSDLDPEVAQLAEALAAAEERAAENLDGWQRARADFLNYKRRIEGQMESMRGYVTGDIIAEFLPVIDDLGLALQNLPDTPAAEKWADGIALVHRKLDALLEKHEVERLPGKGEAFDPAMHEAISQEDSAEHESGEIIEVLREGYRMGERILRPSLVRVAS